MKRKNNSHQYKSPELQMKYNRELANKSSLEGTATYNNNLTVETEEPNSLETKKTKSRSSWYQRSGVWINDNIGNIIFTIVISLFLFFTLANTFKYNRLEQEYAFIQKEFSDLDDQIYKNDKEMNELYNNLCDKVDESLLNDRDNKFINEIENMLIELKTKYDMDMKYITERLNKLETITNKESNHN